MVFAIANASFTTTYVYDDVDFFGLEERYGRELMERIYFHIAAFEINKVASLRPTSLNWGPMSHLVTAEFKTLWKSVFGKVWAQWRYENDLPHYHGPEFGASKDARSPGPWRIEGDSLLAFCGGGKDSLVALKLLERGGLDFATFAYSHSVYGDHQEQHRLVDGLLRHCPSQKHHRQRVDDDFLEAWPGLGPRFGVKSVAAAETPSSLFAALPLALQHGYAHFVLAHERSADRGNLVWNATGEEVNHQWGKSLEAERLLDDYVRLHLLENFRYYSLLKPIQDVLIFQLLQNDLQAVRDAHSCNVKKPWCCQCAKCAYVWINYCAYLPLSTVEAIFGHNLLDIPANQIWFRQMLGLEEHTPFECVGEVEEARLAFELCRRKGMTGVAMETFEREVAPVDLESLLTRYMRVDEGHHRIPPGVAERVLPLMQLPLSEGADPPADMGVGDRRPG